MEEKSQLLGNSLPLQAVYGEGLLKNKAESKFARRFPVKTTPQQLPSQCKSQSRPPDLALRTIKDRRPSRKVIRDYKTDSPVHNIFETRTFAKTFTGASRSGSNDWLSGQSSQFVPQELISSTQGFLHTVLHQPRVSTIDRELVIIILEGVIANYAQRELVIRADSISMLKELHLRYQVVIVSGWKLARVLKILSYLGNKGVYISAVYKQVGHGSGISEEFERKRHAWYGDYSRVYKDFNITAESAKKVVCVVPLLGNLEEFGPPHFVVQYTGALRPTFMVDKAPIPIAQYPFIPVALLVPHIAHSSVSLMVVAETIKSLATAKNFYLAAHSLKDKHFQFHISDVLNREILSLYLKKKFTEIPKSLYLIMKSGYITDIITLHKEKDTPNQGYTTLLDFTLQVFN